MVDKMNIEDEKKFFIDFVNTHENWGKLLSNTNKIEYVRIRQFLFEVTKFVPPTARMSQRGWHVINDVYHIPKCLFCDNIVSYNRNKHTYRRTCSKECSSKDSTRFNNFKKTNIERYGVPYPAMNKKVYEKTIETNLKRYGVKYTSQYDATKIKQRENNIKKYGVISTSQLKHIRDKQKSTNIERYGYEFANSTILSEATRNLLQDKNWLIDQHHVQKKSATEIGEILNCNPSTVSNYLNLHDIEIKYFFSSHIENSIKNFLLSINVNYVSNDRLILNGSELDIFIPEKNIAIELNGVYWHSEKFKHKNFHHNKYMECKNKGIRLIQILETEWIRNPILIKEKLSNILFLSDRPSVYARKTDIIKVNAKNKSIFFEKNHIQGNGPSSINYGLEYNNELVACIGFIKNNDGSYTLNRYATSSNVVGGFTKLISHFEKVYNNPKIITFADLRWSEGDLYHKTGFTMDKELKPDYYWTKGTKIYHKFNFRHTTGLKKLGNYDPNLSESENMHNHGYYKIYDAGKLRFVKN